MQTSEGALSRRRFTLSLCGLPFAGLPLDAGEFAGMEWNQPATVARVYLASPTVHWPKPTLDIAKDVADIERQMAEVGRQTQTKRPPHRRRSAQDRRRSSALARQDGRHRRRADHPAHAAHPAAARPLVNQLQVPALFFSRPYATHAWSSIAGMRRRPARRSTWWPPPATATSIPTCAMFRTVHHLRKSKVLVGVATPAGRTAQPPTPTRSTSAPPSSTSAATEFKAAFDAADAKQAQKEADEFTRGALRVVEPTPKEILDGLRFYLALKNMMKRGEGQRLHHRLLRHPARPTHCPAIRASRGRSSTTWGSTASARPTCTPP